MGRKHIPQSAGDEDQDIKAIIQRSRYCEESVPDTAAVPKSPHKRKESVAKRLNFTQRVREIAALAKTFQKDLEIKRRCADALATLVNAEVRRKFADRIPSVFDVYVKPFSLLQEARARVMEEKGLVTICELACTDDEETMVSAGPAKAPPVPHTYHYRLSH